MHPSLLVTAAALGGALTGALLVLVLPASTPPAPPMAPASSGSAAAALPCPEASAPMADARARETELEGLLFTERLLRGQLALVGGLPIPWPDDVDPRWTEAPLSGRIEEALAPGTALLELDCSEYPCVAIYEVEDDAAHRRDHLPAVGDDPLLGQISGHYRTVRSADGDRTIAVIAYHEAEPGEHVEQRLTRREAAAFERIETRMTDGGAP